MSKKLPTIYQVCPDAYSGWNTLHDNLQDAIKEARDYANERYLEDGKVIHLHVCKIEEVVQVGPVTKRRASSPSGWVSDGRRKG